MTAFNKTKAEAQAFKDMTARETALKQLGIEDVFEFADHAEIYNSELSKQSMSAFRPLPTPPVTLHPERSPERSPTPEAHRARSIEPRCEGQFFFSQTCFCFKEDGFRESSPDQSHFCGAL